MSDLKIIQIGGLVPPRENRQNPSRGRVFSKNGISPCLDTFQGGGLQPHVVVKDMQDTKKTICLNSKDENGKQPSCNDRVYSTEGTSVACCTAPFFQGNICDKYRIRKLTPKECFRLQGWSDEYFNRAEMVNSNAQLYKQAGNGVIVDVIYHIVKELE